MKNRLLSTVAVAMAVFFTSNLAAQTYKPDYATKLVLAGGGPSGPFDITKTITMAAVIPGSSFTYTWPDKPTSGTWILSGNSAGTLSWVDASTGGGITLAGDVSGAANTTTVDKIKNIPLSMTGIADANLLIYNSASGGTWASKPMSGDANITNAGAVSIQSTAGNNIVAALNAGTTSTAINTPVAITAAGLTSSAGFTTSGGAVDMNMTGSNAVNIGATSYTGTITIGNATGPSTTALNGTVTFGTMPTLPLATNNIYRGVGGNATAYAPVANSVLVTAGTGGLVPTWATSLPSALTIPSPTITNPTITGTFTLPNGSVTNDMLVNNSLTITTAAGSGLAGGSTQALGGTWTLSIPTSGVTNAMLAGSIAASKLVGSDIATVGTVTAGTWNANTITPGYGGTGIASYAIGDILYASGATALTARNIGSAGQVLTVAGGVPTWANSGATISMGVSTDITGSSVTVDGTTSLYMLNPTASYTLSSITGGTTGRLIVLVNKSATYTVTLATGGNLTLQAGDSIPMGPNGTATLVYDGAAWRVIANY